VEKELIYIMGAGRSGTTALATFLGNSRDIFNAGELHHFFNHLAEKEKCSCGEELLNCKFWKQVIERLPENFINEADIIASENRIQEFHKAIPEHLFNLKDKNVNHNYLERQDKLLNSIAENTEKTKIIDSAKYIGRALALYRSGKVKMKIIYMVRDPRGVAWSMNTRWLMHKGLLETVIYYLFINYFASFTFIFLPKENIIKINYEELINQPLETFAKLEDFLAVDLSDIKDKIKNNDDFLMGHIIGGNRIKSNKTIKFSRDIEWIEQMTTFHKIFFYFLALPLMIKNKYKILP